MAIAVIISVLTFFHPSFWHGTKPLLNDLFARETLEEMEQGYWHIADPVLLLSTCFILRVLVFFLFVTSPIPNGVFAPSVCLGAVFGRLYAVFFNKYFS